MRDFVLGSVGLAGFFLVMHVVIGLVGMTVDGSRMPSCREALDHANRLLRLEGYERRLYGSERESVILRYGVARDKCYNQGPP